jgi:hypothetical protein
MQTGKRPEEFTKNQKKSIYQKPEKTEFHYREKLHI